MHPRSSFFLAVSLIVLGVGMRFLPHPANFAPIAAIALFSGTYLKRWYAFAVPLAAMIVSDAFIGFHSIIWATWGCFALTGVIGFWIRRNNNIRRMVLGSLCASVIFYLVTNWATWAFTPLYTKDAAGLAASYIAAIPFFRNTILGDLFYSGMLFGLYELAAIAIRRRTAQAITISHHD